MIGKDDKLIEVKLYTPSDSDFICERPDGTRYVYEVRKKDKRTYELNNEQSKN